MADSKKQKMTRYEFIEWACDAAHDSGNEIIIAAAEAALKAEQKKRDRAANTPKTESKEKKLNRIKALEIMRAIYDAGNEPRGTQWIGEHVSYCDTSHKVTGKMNIARANGWVSYGETVNGKRTWFVTETGIAALEAPAE